MDDEVLAFCNFPEYSFEEDVHWNERGCFMVEFVLLMLILIQVLERLDGIQNLERMEWKRN